MGGGRSSLVKGRRAWATAETLLAEDHSGDRSRLCEGEGSGGAQTGIKDILLVEGCAGTAEDTY